MPPNTISVTRPGPWGNPFTVAAAKDVGIRLNGENMQRFLVRVFEEWLTDPVKAASWWLGPKSDARRAEMLRRLPELRGKNLACWCAEGTPCHADVLLRLANAPEATP